MKLKVFKCLLEFNCIVCLAVFGDFLFEEYVDKYEWVSVASVFRVLDCITSIKAPCFSFLVLILKIVDVGLKLFFGGFLLDAIVQSMHGM